MKLIFSGIDKAFFNDLAFNNQVTARQCTTASFLSVPDSVLEHDMLSFLSPADSSRAARAHRDCAAPARGRLARSEIRVPEDCSSLNAALAEVSFLICQASPYAIPAIIVGPGKHILKGGLMTICDSGVIIRGAGGAGCVPASASSPLSTKRATWRTRRGEPAQESR